MALTGLKDHPVKTAVHLASVATLFLQPELLPVEEVGVEGTYVVIDLKRSKNCLPDPDERTGHPSVRCVALPGCDDSDLYVRLVITSDCSLELT